MKITTSVIFFLILGIYTNTDSNFKLIDHNSKTKIDTCNCNSQKSLDADVSFEIPEALYKFDKISISIMLMVKGNKKEIAYDSWSKLAFATKFPSKKGELYNIKFIKTSLLSKKYNKSDASNFESIDGGVFNSEDLCKLKKFAAGLGIDGAVDILKDKTQVFKLILEIAGHSITGYDTEYNGDGSTSTSPRYGKTAVLLESDTIFVVQPQKK